MTRHRLLSLLVLVSALALVWGCSNGSIVSPGIKPGEITRPNALSSGTHHTWGTWEIAIDLEQETISAIPHRTSDLHYNVVPLLHEGTPGSAIKFANLKVDSLNHLVTVDVSLTHPFPTLPQVAGFDVRGILFTRGGSYNLFAADVQMAGPDEPRLVNADGYTRWWNPDEFPNTGLLGYTNGLYGTPDSVGGYTINLAGYKLYADSLTTLDTLDALDTDDRAVFRAGSTNTRRYVIDFGSTAGNWLIFNYAIDACWGPIPGFDPGGPPPTVPGDFPLTANSPEPYRIRVTETANTLSATTAGGTTGSVSINIDVFDWQALNTISTVPMEVSIVQVESPTFGLGPQPANVVVGSGAGSNVSTYTATLNGITSTKYDYVDLIITATSSEGDYQNDITDFPSSNPLQAFFLYRARVTDADIYTDWTYQYSKPLIDEPPNQGLNPPDIAVYEKNGEIRTATVDQVNADPNHEGDHKPDSINEWSNDYESYSIPEHYHLPVTMLDETGLWDDIGGITVSDTSTRFFFSTTNINDEFPDDEGDPLFCYISWVTHTYLGNQAADFWNTAFFSADTYPRMWATDPCNGVNIATDFIYSIWVYDVTGLAGGDPGANPQRYVIFRWKPPYDLTTSSVKWQRPTNVQPSGVGTGYLDIDKPYNHRLGVDDSPALDRFYILDSAGEIEVMDCDFNLDEFSGYTSVGTVTVDELPVDSIRIMDLEVVPTKDAGTLRNHVAALLEYPGNQWRVWVFDFDTSFPVGDQATMVWLSELYNGVPYALDAADDPIEAHVLHQIGGFVYVTVFRRY